MMDPARLLRSLIASTTVVKISTIEERANLRVNTHCADINRYRFENSKYWLTPKFSAKRVKDCVMILRNGKN